MTITPYKLICESGFDEIIVEREQQNASAPKNYYIKGIYAVPEKINGNGRSYEASALKKAVETYIEEAVKPRRACGELNHPPSSEIDFNNACHIVESIDLQDGVWVGRSKVLRGTPKGDLLIGLLDNGVRVGVSTRGVGVMTEAKRVTEFKLVAVDAVSNPSGPGCFVDGILESKNYMVNQHGEIIEMVYQTLEKKIQTLPVNSIDRKRVLTEACREFLKGIKK